MNVQTITHQLQNEGLRARATRRTGRYLCVIETTKGKAVSASTETTLPKAVETALSQLGPKTGTNLAPVPILHLK